MATEGWTNAELDSYYDPVVGTEIVRVHHDADAVWLHLSDGSMLEIVAETVGFSVEIHPHDARALPRAAPAALLTHHGDQET